MNNSSFPNDIKRTVVLHPLLVALMQSDYWRALRFSIAAMVCADAALALTNNATLDTLINVNVVMVLIAFGLLALAEFAKMAGVWWLTARLAWAQAEAELEKIARRDLNHSGAIGDVVAPLTKLPPDFLQVKVGAELVNVHIDHLRQVVFANDITRARWLGVEDKAPVEPFVSQLNSRLYFDAMMTLLEQHVQVKRGDKNSRQLKYAPAQVWTQLGLPI